MDVLNTVVGLLGLLTGVAGIGYGILANRRQQDAMKVIRYNLASLNGGIRSADGCASSMYKTIQKVGQLLDSTAAGNQDRQETLDLFRQTAGDAATAAAKIHETLRFLQANQKALFGIAEHLQSDGVMVPHPNESKK